MTLLEDWQKKKSWKNQLPLIPVYYDGKDMDIDLSAMIKKNKDNLTLDVGSLTGFKEIGYIDHLMPQFDFGDVRFLMQGVNNIAKMLIIILREHIKKCWDSNKFHLIFCSGGTDSRILSLILKRMWDGGFDLGEFMFLCHGSEIPTFLETMKDQEWKNYNYLAYKQGFRNETDYYEYGRFENNMNAFIAPQLDFYSDIIEHLNLKSICLVSGSYGGELFMYPSRGINQSYIPTNHGKQFIDIEHLRLFARCPAFYLNQWYTKFDDILMPYLSYEYLDFAMQIKKPFFIKESGLNDKQHWTLDIIRAEMLKELGNNTPIVNKRHVYNLDFSVRKRYGINYNWENSKLYKDFPEVRKYNPSRLMPISTIATKLYGLATCYEVAKNEV